MWQGAELKSRAGRRIELTLNGRVVLVDEMRLDELNSQCRLSDTCPAVVSAILASPEYADVPPPPTTTSLYSLKNCACWSSVSPPPCTWEILTHPGSHCSSKYEAN